MNQCVRNASGFDGLRGNFLMIGLPGDTAHTFGVRRGMGGIGLDAPAYSVCGREKKP